ncbi:MAG: hypothetical protein QW728_08085, partial [Thermoplasmata archaeon]
AVIQQRGMKLAESDDAILFGSLVSTLSHNQYVLRIHPGRETLVRIGQFARLESGEVILVYDTRLLDAGMLKYTGGLFNREEIDFFLPEIGMQTGVFCWALAVGTAVPFVEGNARDVNREVEQDKKPPKNIGEKARENTRENAKMKKCGYHQGIPAQIPVAGAGAFILSEDEVREFHTSNSRPVLHYFRYLDTLAGNRAYYLKELILNNLKKLMPEHAEILTMILFSLNRKYEHSIAQGGGII